MPFYVFESIEVLLYIILFTVPILFLPRIYRYLNKRYNLKISTSSSFSDYLTSIELIREDGILNEYYSVLYGGFSNNSKRLWIFKLSTVYAFLLLLIGMLYFSSPIRPLISSSIVLKIIPLLLLLLPVVFISIHLIKIEHNYFLIFVIIYSLVFYLLLISSYLMIYVLFIHIIFRLLKNMLQRLRIVVRI
jgi:hypothetical protein